MSCFQDFRYPLVRAKIVVSSNGLADPGNSTVPPAPARTTATTSTPAGRFASAPVCSRSADARRSPVMKRNRKMANNANTITPAIRAIVRPGPDADAVACEASGNR